MNNVKLFLLFPLLLALCLIFGLQAQNGRWVEIPKPSDIGSGKEWMLCGKSCAIFTKENSKYLFIYNAALGEWQNIALDPMWHIHFFQVRGPLFFGYTDAMVFVYDATQNHLDTLRYEGTVLSKYSVERYCSFGSSEKLAFLMTTQKIYIYDTDLNRWQAFDYNIPDKLGSGSYFIDNECLTMSLNTTGQPLNVVYDVHSKELQQYDQGVFITKKFNGGFVGAYHNQYDYTLLGYSARNNTFQNVQYQCASQNESAEFFFTSDLQSDSNFVFACAFNRVGDQDVTINFFGYSLLTKTWTQWTYSFPRYGSEYYSDNGINMGQYAFARGNYEADGGRFYELFTFSAKTGIFSLMKTNLNCDNVNTWFSNGSSVLAIADEKEMLGIDPCSMKSKQMALEFDRTGSLGEGEDYAVLENYNSITQEASIIFYNRLKNNFTPLPKTYIQSANNLTAPFIFVCNMLPENTIIFYDPLTDLVFQRACGANDYVQIDQTGRLAFASTEQVSYLFNAQNQQIYEKPFEIKKGWMGSQACVSIDKSALKLQGYSAITDQWTELDLSEEAYMLRCEKDIGLVSVLKNNDVYGQFYAFNSHTNAFVELTPAGNHVGHSQGQSILLLQQSTHLYVFDPEIPTFLDDTKQSTDRNWQLFPNYPNPFNYQTTLSFRLNKTEKIKLELYNALGQKVKRMASGIFSPGLHKIDADLRSLPSGIYFIRLSNTEKSTTRKCLLIK